MSDSQKLWADVDQYFAGHFVPHDTALSASLSASSAAGLPDIAVAPNQGKLLNMLVRMTKARRILEVGTLGGYSTIWMARALPMDGKVVTLELDPKHASVAMSNFERAGLSGVIELRQGAAIKSLEHLLHEGTDPFDLVFIDADKASIPSYFEYALKLTKPGSVILVDNVVRQGGVIDANSGDANINGVRKFSEMVSREPRVSATVLQTVGIKGYDGLAILLVVDPIQAS